MVEFAYRLGKRLAMEKPASKFVGAGARQVGKRVLPWLTRQGGRLLSSSKPIAKQLPAAATNWWSRASQFGSGVKPLWDLGWKSSLGLYGAQQLGLTPKWADPGINAYFWWSMPKTMMFEKALNQLTANNAGSNNTTQSYETRNPSIEYLNAVNSAAEQDPYQYAAEPNYFASVFGRPR